MNKQLSRVERLIIQSRLTGRSFFELNNEDMRHSVDQIMLRGAAITGASLPQTEFFATFIFSELSIFLLKMGYDELTLEEVLFALRLNASGDMRNNTGDSVKIEFRGQSFNVAFIADVLSVYKAIRNNLDRKLQNEIDGY